MPESSGVCLDVKQEDGCWEYRRLHFVLSVCFCTKFKLAVEFGCWEPTGMLWGGWLGSSGEMLLTPSLALGLV